MANYTISETSCLPSKGLIYNTEVVPEVTLRSMTTADEMRRLSHSDYPNKPICDVLDSCVVSGLGMSSYDLCLGDYQFLLHKLRIATYGSKIKASTTCPICKFVNEEEINLDEFTVKDFDENCLSLLEVDLPVSKNHLKLRFQTPRIADKISVGTTEMKKKAKDKFQDYGMLVTLTNVIESIDGRTPSVIELEDWVRKLPMKDVNLIFANLSKFNDSIGLDCSMTANCYLCGYNYNLQYQPDSEFFRPTN